MLEPVIVNVRAIDCRRTGARAKKQRLAAGLSIRDVAKGVRVSPSHLYKLENGTRGWSDELVKAFNHVVFSFAG